MNIILDQEEGFNDINNVIDSYIVKSFNYYFPIIEDNIYASVSEVFGEILYFTGQKTQYRDLLQRIHDKEAENSKFDSMARVFSRIKIKSSYQNVSADKLGIEASLFNEVLIAFATLKYGKVERIKELDYYINLLNDVSDSHITIDNYTDVELIKCDKCHNWHITISDNQNGLSYCGECLKNDFEYCHECGDIIPRTEAIEIAGYKYCDFCGKLLEESSNKRNNYGFKPAPMFFPPNNNRYYGVENELIMTKGWDNTLFENAEICQNYMVYGKSDGSITEGSEYDQYDYGIEFVSHPMSLQYHEDNMEEFLEYLACSHAEIGANTGLHIHVNKSCLPITVFKTVELFIESHIDEFLQLSRRESFGQYCVPKTEDTDGVENKKEILENGFNNFGRYHLVNFKPKNTVEFRFFNATVDYEEYMASLYIIESLLNYFDRNDYIFSFKAWKEYATKHNNILYHYFNEYLIDFNEDSDDNDENEDNEGLFFTLDENDEDTDDLMEEIVNRIQNRNIIQEDDTIEEEIIEEELEEIIDDDEELEEIIEEEDEEIAVEEIIEESEESEPSETELENIRAECDRVIGRYNNLFNNPHSESFERYCIEYGSLSVIRRTSFIISDLRSRNTEYGDILSILQDIIINIGEDYLVYCSTNTYNKLNEALNILSTGNVASFKPFEYYYNLLSNLTNNEVNKMNILSIKVGNGNVYLEQL